MKRKNDQMSAEAAQRIAASVRRAGVTLPAAQSAMQRLTEVLRAFNENPNTLFMLARAQGRKFPGDRGYQWYHFRRWVRGQERWPW